MLIFRQSENTAARRLWMVELVNLSPASEVPVGTKNGVNVTFTVSNPPQYLTLNGQTLTAGGVDYTLSGLTITMVTAPQSTDVFLSWYDGAPLTGQGGNFGYLSKNGAAAVQTTNSLTEIDSTNMPGAYYIQLTAAEVNTIGSLALYVKTTSSKVYRETAMVTYDDPYSFHGGFPVGTASKVDMQKLNWKKLMEMIRQAVKEEVEKIEIHEDKDESEKLDKILEAVTAEENTEHEEAMMQAMSELQKCMDDMENMMKKMSKEMDHKPLMKQMEEVHKKMAVDMEKFYSSVNTFQGKINVSNEQVNNLLNTVTDITSEFTKLEAVVKQLETTVVEQSDMDKRFDKLAQAANNKKIEELTQAVNEFKRTVMTALVNYKFDILKNLR